MSNARKHRGEFPISTATPIAASPAKNSSGTGLSAAVLQVVPSGNGAAFDAAATPAIPQVIPTIYTDAASESQEVRAALLLNSNFAPDPDVNYEWASKHAREQFQTADAAFVKADEKAASIMGYLGSGTGLFALGSIAGLATNQLNAWVAFAAVPALIFAALALAFASLSRRPFAASYPPSAKTALDRLEQFGPKREREAEASLITIWHLATTMVQHATHKKSLWIRKASWMFVTAVGCLLLPLAIATGQKLTADKPDPPSIPKAAN